jgi:hypothetical protein
VTIWPGLPAPHPATGPCAGPVTAEAAAAVITAFSRPGDLIAAPDSHPAVTGAAGRAGRSAAGLILPRGRTGGPALLLVCGGPGGSQAALAITGRHGPGCCAGPPQPGQDEPEPGPVLAACHQVLRPGGILAILTAAPAPGTRLTDQAGYLTATARAAGLIYTQHIVLVHAAIRDGHLAPGSPAPAGTAAPPGGHRVHTDLLVFTKP